jgi:hypothetical protein
MLSLKERIELLVQLGEYLEREEPALTDIMLKSSHQNGWFTIQNYRKALQQIRENFLKKGLLTDWAVLYSIPIYQHHIQTIGLVMAGNIPLVGFHDMLSVVLSGHKALIKLSEKDSLLMPHLLDWMVSQVPQFSNSWEITDRLHGLDAVIATGSNNSARYFHAYFGKYPHLIRANRSGIAVLNGSELPEDLHQLGEDIFSYFGLGCRNVSKIYVPHGYDFVPLLSALDKYKWIMDHHKYCNNYEYQYAILLLNKVDFYQGETVLLVENESYYSPVGTINYQFYDSDTALQSSLESNRSSIQCLIAKVSIPGWETLKPGSSQCPSLTDYADGADTMAFLQSLSNE